MASTYSGGVGRLQLMADGENSGVWGQILNANFQVLEEMVSGHSSHNVAGSGTTTLANDADVGSSFSTSQAKSALITLTGTVSGNHDVVAPAREGWYIIQDTSTGNFDLTFKPSGGTGVVIPRGGKTFMFTDGSTMFNLLDEVNRLSEINDADNNEVLKFGTTASAVNEITITNAATGNRPTIQASGGDSNVGISITPKGSGNVTVSGTMNTAAISSSSSITATSFTGDGANLTGIAPFPAGTKMVFRQSSAPTGWTKDTTASLDDTALRVVVGTVSTGGTHALSSPPSFSHTHTFTGGSNTTSSSGAHTHSDSFASAAHTLTTSEMPAHTHTVAGGARNFSTQGSGGSGAGNEGGFTYYAATDSTGGGGSHTHALSGSVTSGGAHTHTLTPTGTNTAAAPTAFAPKYTDIIIASKD